MEFSFWISVVILSGIAIAFIVIPLIRKNPPASQDQRNAINIAIYKEKLLALDQENLTTEQRAEAQRELEKTLACELEETAPQSPRSRRTDYYTSGAVVLSVPILAVGSYLYLGEPKLLDPTALQAQEQQITAHDIEMMVAALAKRLQTQPNDVTGWRMLARSYVMMERYPEAVSAYEQVIKLTGEKDPALLTDLAEALALANGGQWQGRPITLLETALKLEAQAQKTLWLAGVAAVQQKDYPKALTYWQTLLAQIPATEAEKRQLVEKQISRVQQLIQNH